MKNNKTKFRTLIIFITFSAAFLSFTPANPDKAEDYLSVGRQLRFDNEDFDLKWSSNPTVNYNKQEYLRSNDNLESFNKMILVEAIEGNLKIKDAINAKVNELNKRKKWDFVANYQIYENKQKKNECIIDFVVSDTMTIYEWNLYRYQIQKDENNKNYMVLFAYSYREILNDNNDLRKFFEHIKSNRVDMINKLQEFTIPKVKINK